MTSGGQRKQEIVHCCNYQYKKWLFINKNKLQFISSLIGEHVVENSFSSLMVLFTPREHGELWYPYSADIGVLFLLQYVISILFMHYSLKNAIHYNFITYLIPSSHQKFGNHHHKQM